MRRQITLLVIGALVGALLMLSTQAVGESLQIKHFACYAGNSSQPHRAWYYLPNGADPCPTGYVKIDWVDD
jgi:hypothetical protein